MTHKTELQGWIDEWAERIEALNLSPIALPLLEIARAFGFLGGQVLFIVQPLVDDLVSAAAVERTAMLLNDPETLEQLSKRLERED